MTTANMPTLAADAIAELDEVLNPRDAASAALEHRPPATAGRELLAAVDALEAFAGPAMAAPIRRLVDDVVTELRVTIGDLERTQEVAEARYRLAGRLEAVARGARTALVAVGSSYAERDAAAVEAELLAAELEEVITELARRAELSISGDHVRLTPGMAASRLREARKRATRKAAELLADEEAQRTSEAGR